MRCLLLLVYSLSVLSIPQIAKSESYSNSGYGISLETPSDWEVVESAKLDIDLKTLTFDQLSELSRAYGEGNGVLRLQKKSEDGMVVVTIRFSASRSVKGTTDVAKSWQHEDRETIVEPTELRVGNVNAGYLVQKVGRNKPSYWHQLIIPRTRSYMTVIAQFPPGDAESQQKELESLLSTLNVDTAADRPN